MLKGTLWSLPMEPRVPHVASFFARAPSSLLFCGVRNTHKYLAICNCFGGIWPIFLLLLNLSALALFAQHTCIPTSARSIGFCAIWVCISSSSSSSSRPKSTRYFSGHFLPKQGIVFKSMNNKNQYAAFLRGSVVAIQIRRQWKRWSSRKVSQSRSL